MNELTTHASLSFQEVFFGLLIALAAGALIGLEREQSGGHRRVGGVRTFPLVALAGALSAFLAHAMGAGVVVGSLLVVGVFLGAAYYQEAVKDRSPGATTEVAALVTFLLGVLALLPGLPLATGERYILIVASAAVVMALLSFKEPLHQAVKQISADDLYATAKFVILALVLLPLLPNRTLGPLDVLNPFNIGLMVVLIAGISFVGYIAARVMSEGKSLAATGVIGGMISSTATTISLSTRARQATGSATPAAAGILAASGTMFVRMLLVVGIVDVALLPPLLPPLGAMTLATYVMTLFLVARTRSQSEAVEPVPHRNPFELRLAFQFGVIYAMVIFAAKGAQTFFSDAGLYVTSVLAGTTDVDAITLSLTRFHRNGLDPRTAVIALTLAAMTNTAVKGGLAAWFGRGTLARQIAPGLGAALVTGAAVLFFVW